MKFDNLLQLLGEFGFYQKRLYTLICLPIVSCGIQTMISVFILGVPEHRCRIPHLYNDTFSLRDSYHEHIVNNTIPYATEDGSLKYSSCEIFTDLNKTRGLDLQLPWTRNDTRKHPWTRNDTRKHSCNQWIYSKESFDTTFVTQTSMVCQKQIYRTHLMMAFMGGFTAGSLALGIVADGFGRKKAMLMSIFMHIFSSIGISFAPNFLIFFITRFIQGVSVGGLLGSAFVMGMEIVGPSKRMWAGIVIELFWAAGCLILAALAYFVRNWQHLQLAVSTPTALFIIYGWIIPESPRWLIAKGNDIEAENILRRAAKVNKVELPEKLFDHETLDEHQRCVPIWRIFVSKAMVIRALIIFYNWMVVSMVYYGLGLNVGNLAGNVYLNFFLSSMAEIIGFCSCLLFLNRCGRKPVHCGSMIIGGCACLLTIFTVLYSNKSEQWTTVTLAMIGKTGASAAFATIWVFSAELFPTTLRNSAMGASSLCARIGGMIAPYIAEVTNIVAGDVGQAVPLVIFGLVAVSAGLLSLFLPETLNRDLPETVEDAKRFTRKFENVLLQKESVT